jgi:hypothetical protein
MTELYGVEVFKPGFCSRKMLNQTMKHSAFSSDYDLLLRDTGEEQNDHAIDPIYDQPQ